MELNVESGDSRKGTKKRPAPTDEPSTDGMVEVQMVCSFSERKFKHLCANF
jgi:hypothetical protein